MKPTNSVVVTATPEGQIVTPSSNNPEYGYIRVEHTRAVFEGGWARKKTISALIPGKTAELKDLGFTAGMELPGRVQVKEQLEPFNADNPDSDAKIAGETGIPCCLDGEQIYRKTFYTESEADVDVLIQHNNNDAIKEAYAKIEAEKEAAL